MKVYDREKKKWVTEEEYNFSHSKGRSTKICRGGKPHKFEPALPSYVKIIGYPSKETIDEYYKSEKRKRDFLEKEDKVLEKFGIITSDFRNYRNYVFLVCEVCGKHDYYYPDKME